MRDVLPTGGLSPKHSRIPSIPPVLGESVLAMVHTLGVVLNPASLGPWWEAFRLWS